MAEDAHQMRRIFLSLGHNLRKAGFLESAADIFYLHYREVQDLFAGTPEAPAVREKITRRKAEMEADARLELNDTICEASPTARPLAALQDQEYLVGISGSSGIARGYARVVFDPAEVSGEIGADDILVVPFTDVGWTPLFSAVGGVVAETGGQLSHSAIVAREYSLPAVVSVKQATLLIRTGQPLTVDGNRGRVYLRHVEEGGEG
jgi:pyruvate,water dikinase